MKNVELAPEERTLIAAARDTAGPTEFQRARVRKGLDAKIAAGIAAPVLATSAGLATLLKVGAGVAIAAVIGSGAIYLAGPRPSTPAALPDTSKPRPAHRAAVPLPTPASEPELAPDIEAPPAVVADPRATPSPSHPRSTVRRREPTPPSPVDLAGELGLLTQASAATKKGDIAHVDEILRTYDQRYPAGQLAQERAAAGVLAHCAAGRREMARTEARRFVERWPRSPLVARIQGSCAMEDKAR
jgi:hypothetical protein